MTQILTFVIMVIPIENNVYILMKVNEKPILQRKIAIATSIVNAQYDLELNEKNIIYLALAKINQFEKMEVGAEWKVEVSDFALVRGKKDDCGIVPIRNDSAKLELNKALKSLYEKSIKLGPGEEHRWITGYKNTEKTGENYIILKWNPDLIPHLAELKTYANLLTGSLSGIKGKYTNRILELISQGRSKGRKTGQVKVDVIEFLNMIQASNTYKEYKYLKKYVLLPSIAELDKLKVAKIYLEDKQDRGVDRRVKSFILNWEFLD